MTTTVVVGNPKPRSRTYETAVSLAHRLTDRPPDATFDLVDFGPALLHRAAPEVGDAVQVVTSSSLVLDDSPALTNWLDAAVPRLAALGVLA